MIMSLINEYPMISSIVFSLFIGIIILLLIFIINKFTYSKYIHSISNNISRLGLEKFYVSLSICDVRKLTEIRYKVSHYNSINYKYVIDINKFIYNDKYKVNFLIKCYKDILHQVELMILCNELSKDSRYYETIRKVSDKIYKEIVTISERNSYSDELNSLIRNLPRMEK